MFARSPSLQANLSFLPGAQHLSPSGSQAAVHLPSVRVNLRSESCNMLHVVFSTNLMRCCGVSHIAGLFTEVRVSCFALKDIFHLLVATGRKFNVAKWHANSL